MIPGEIAAGLGGDPADGDIVARRCLVACVAGRWDPVALERERRLAAIAGFDWDRWLAVGRQESLLPLLHDALHAQAWVPTKVRQELHAAYVRCAVRNTVLLAELEAALGLLASAGIVPIVLKGAALAEVVYGSAALRPMVDVDLLVHPEDVGQALQTLQALGYRKATVESRPGIALAFESEVMLVKEGRREALVEVHWHLLDSPFHQRMVDLAWFWETARSMAFGAQKGLALGSEAQLVYLCAHLALHHRGQGLLWLNDVAEVIRHDEGSMDWGMILAKAQALDLVLPLQQVLPAVKGGWSAPIPDDVMLRLAALRPSAAEAQVFRWLTAAQRPVAARFWADLAGQRSWRQRAAYGWAQLFPSAAYMRARYRLRHPALVPLAYPYRWGIGLVEWLRSQR